MLLGGLLITLHQIDRSYVLNRSLKKNTIKIENKEYVPKIQIIKVEVQLLYKPMLLQDLGLGILAMSYLQ